ncbi:MAG: hypothetical protein HYV16_07815 [Gammaproteobacteria bacterium]|nr:hypothetical protein [Gammaproteobacteria bacterium]
MLRLAPRFRFGLWLALMLVLAGVAWRGYGQAGAVQTDLMALLPATEHNPRAEQAAAALAREGERRSLFLVGASSRAAARRGAEVFHASLERSGVYAALRFRVPPLQAAALLTPFAPYRFGLLGETDRAALQVGDTQALAQRSLKRLFSPLAGGVGLPLAQDPYATLADWLAGRAWRAGRLQLDEGLLAAQDGDRHYVFLSGELEGSAFDGELQARVATAVAAAEAELKAAQPDAELLRLGAVHYAAAARAQAEDEISTIGLGSGLGIALLMLLVFRRWQPLALSYLPVAAGVLAGAAVCVAVFGRVHVITLVFGASLIGGAVDYALHYFVAQLEDGRRWDAQAGLRRIFPGISFGVAAASLGYAGLVFAPFAALQQITVYAVAGLAAAWLTTVAALPLLLRRPGRDGSALLAGTLALAERLERPLAGARLWLLFAAIVLACLPGLARLQADDDIHLLHQPPADLKAQEDRLRQLAGGTAGGQFFLVEAGSAGELLEREEALGARLDPLVASGSLSEYTALTRFLPSPARQAQNRALYAGLLDGAAAQSLLDLGLEPAVLERLRAELGQAKDLELNEFLGMAGATRVRPLYLGVLDGRHASLVMPGRSTDFAALAAAAQGLAGVSYVDKAGSVSRLFTAYRENASLLVSLAFAAVFGLLAWRYGPRLGLVAMLPSLVAVACALAVLGYAGLPLTLFNIIALMLVLGIGIDYAVFMLEGGAHEAATLLAVSLSALTTMLSFGLLALSQTPALRTFGLSVLVGIAVAHTLTPLIRNRRKVG